MNVFDEFKTVDELYLGPEQAYMGLLLEIPGGKRARTKDVAEQMLAAARHGVGWFYKQLVSREAWLYQDRLEKVLKRLKPPEFSEPPIPAEQLPPEMRADAERTISGCVAFYNMTMATLQARHHAQEIFGPNVERIFLDNPRDGVKVAMTLEILRNAFDAHYEETQAVELALIAVVIGLELPMSSPGDPDDGTNRRGRWQQTLIKSKELLSQELVSGPPPEGAR